MSTRLSRLALLALLLPTHAWGQLLHRVEPGENANGLALQYYGDPRFADLIAAHNDLRGEPSPGVELRIPSASRHTVRRGESWRDLASRYWSNATLGPALARWCGRASEAAPAERSDLIIPALVAYRIRPGETVVSLARRFYGDAGRAEDLARLNRLGDPDRIRTGQLVRIALLEIAHTESQPAQARSTTSGDSEPTAASLASDPRPDVAASPAPAAASAQAEPLMAAVNAYLDGSFETALEQLERLRPQVLAKGTKTESELLLRYLTYSYVAFDREDAACDAFQALSRIEKPPSLDPDLVSPKIRNALARCALEP